MPYLVLLQDGAPHVRFSLADGFVVGRASECEVQVLDPRLSRRHARFEERQGAWWVTDLGSRNGTRLEGRPVQEPARITAGDRIDLGGVEALFDPPLELLHARADGASVCLVDVDPGRVEAADGEDGPRALGVDDLWAVHALTCDLLGEVELDRLLPALLAWLCDHFAADRGVVLLREAPSGQLRPAAVRSDRGGLAVSRTLVSRVLEEGQPLRVRDALEDVAFRGARSVAAHSLRSVIVAPLRAGDEIIGLVQLDRKEAGAFAPSDLRRLAEMARVAAPAVQSARRLDLARRRSEAAVSAGGTGSGPIFVGESEAVRRLLGLVERAAATDARVLITGESGTGKELVARLLHDQGRRADGPWVALNCGAIPETLLDSELFGHEKGAFTGAARRRKGCFERADGGTLLLDEVGELPLSTQVRLLRVLQEGAFYRVGGELPVQVDVRVVGATNQDLVAAVEAGRFREDLYYRLNVVHLETPALRARPADVDLLYAHFMERLAPAMGRLPLALDPGAAALLRAYRWPGNARELHNVVERLLVLVEGDVARVADLPPEITATPEASPPGGPPTTLREVLAETEREWVVRALRQSRGRKAAASRALGISRPTLDKKIRDYEIDLDDL